jgi:DNA-binding beta-propeller fold protein YncE
MWRDPIYVFRKKAVGRSVALIAALLVAVAGCNSSASQHRARVRSTAPPAAANTASPSAPRGLRITERLRPHLWVVLATSTGAFVAGGAGKLYRITDGAAHLVASAPSAYWDYDYVQLADGADGTVFVASGSTVWQIDPRSGSVVHRQNLQQLGYLDAVLSTDAGTWVSASGGNENVLARIDLDSGRVLEQIPIGQGIHQLVESAGYLLLRSRNSDPAIARIDPGMGEVTRVPAPEGSMAVIGSRVWVASGNVVACTDAIRLTSCGEVLIERADVLASDGRNLWVLSSTGSKDPSLYVPDPDQPATVTMLDGSTGEVLAGPLALPQHTPATISALDGHAWIGFHDSGTVFRIDPCVPERCAA